MFKYFAVFKSGRLTEYQVGNDFPGHEFYAETDDEAREKAEEWIEEYNENRGTSYKLYMIYCLETA